MFALQTKIVVVDFLQRLQAGELKALHKIPYVDCVAAALAILHQAVPPTAISKSSGVTFQSCRSPVHKRCERNARIATMPKLSPAARARKIKLLLFDVDGVLTDGKIYLFPVPSEGQRPIVVEAKGFSAHDG